MSCDALCIALLLSYLVKVELIVDFAWLVANWLFRVILWLDLLEGELLLQG